MNLLGLTITRTKATPPLAPLSGSASWWPTIRESFSGAWQSNVTVDAGSALTYSAVYACVSLIAADIAKLRLRLVEQDRDGIWSETESAAFSPVLRKPNRYQTIIKFVEQWIISKLTRGNTYVLKQRDQRRVVTALYVLDPSRVTPLVASDGAVYYEIRRDDLSGLTQDSITVPASEIIHDIMCALYHPLIGVSPIYACGIAALQGLSIATNSQKFFANGANPSGMLTAPGAIGDATALRLKAKFDAGAYSGTNAGGVIVAGDGLKYEQFTMTAVDAQLIEQLKWTAETVCSCYHVQPYMIGVGPPPPYANVEPLLQQYHSQCLQNLLLSLETCLDEGLGIDVKVEGKQYGTEFDIGDLIWMDTATRTTAAAGAINAGAMKPNEARKRYFDLGPVKGGDTPYMQQQMHGLSALAERDADKPFAKPAPVAPPVVDEDEDEDEQEDEAKAAGYAATLRKALELHA